jgi:hypothetical protein
VRLRVVDRADKYNRRRLGALALPNERGGLEAVHPRHVHVEQDHREILLEQAAERFLARSRANHILVQLGQHSLVREELVRPVVDNEDADLFLGRLLRDGIRRHD